MPRALAAITLAAVGATCSGTHAGSRVYSLDQCADQYVLALAPRADIAGLSRRATKADSYLRAEVGALPLRRATAESVLAARPAVVVRYWGGDERLVADLRRLGMRVVTIDDAADFSAVRVNVRRVAAALGERRAGEAMIGRMDRRLAAAAGAWRGRGALYLTSGGDTAGRGTLIDAMLRAPGLTNLAPGAGFHALSLERLVLGPPAALVLGFFDVGLDAVQHWSLARQAPVRRLAERRAIVSLPGAILGCPAWFAADAVTRISAAKTPRLPPLNGEGDSPPGERGGVTGGAAPSGKSLTRLLVSDRIHPRHEGEGG
ncbi:MAG: ABC transporter substrate-binding protein [Caulobacteraceae bacterium]